MIDVTKTERKLTTKHSKHEIFTSFTGCTIITVFSQTTISISSAIFHNAQMACIFGNNLSFIVTDTWYWQIVSTDCVHILDCGLYAFTGQVLTNVVKLELKYNFLSIKCTWRCHLQIMGHFIQSLMRWRINIEAVHMHTCSGKRSHHCYS